MVLNLITQQNKKLDERFDALEKRVDNKLNAIEVKLDERLNAFEKSVDSERQRHNELEEGEVGDGKSLHLGENSRFK